MAEETDTTATTQQRYDRQAFLFDLTEVPMELLVFRDLRRKLWSAATGSMILEVGVGTGKNLPFHPDGARVVAVDLSPRMMQRAVERAGRARLKPDFVLADAQRLPFKDGRFDEMVSTFVFCSVPDPVAGLREARRIVREGGGINLLEHVRSANALLGWLMDQLNPIAVRLTGANINRDTVANVKKAKIDTASVASLRLGFLRLIRGHRLESTGEA
jgi:ubiquinone/menaquinone biosynthesis C-methylase UbiE